MYIIDKAIEKGVKDVHYFKEGKQIVQYLIENVKKDDVILFKASNGMKFYQLCDDFIKNL